MATIPVVKAQINTDITVKTGDNTISPGNVGTNMAAMADEIRDRGVKALSNPSGLATLDSADFKIAMVEGVGTFIDSATGPADNVNVFAGVAGRFWQRIGQFSGDVFAPFDTVEVIDDGKYNGFPVVVKRRNDLYLMYMSQPEHIVPSNSNAFQKSTDGGRTWGPRTLITANTLANFGWGLTRSGRIVYVANNGGNSPFQVFRTGEYTDTFTQMANYTNPFTNGVPFGKIIQLPSGRLLCNIYRYDTGSEKTGFISSMDDGQTWSYYADLGNNLNETFIQVISGSTDANTVILAVARVSDNDNGKNKVYRSLNGGLTWNLLGEVPFTKTITYGFPGEMMVYKGRLWMVFGARYSNGNRCVSYFNFPISEYATIANWGPENTFYQSEASVKGQVNDWGYPSLYEYGGELYGIFYDVSPAALAALNADKTRIMILRISNRVEAYFERTSQGTYPAETTFSKIEPLAIRDSGGFFKEISGKYFIVAPEDGFYSISFRGTYANTNMGGSYRKMGIAILDMGYPVDPTTLYPKNPINNAPAPEAVRYIANMVRPNIDDIDVLTMEITATCWVRKGNEIMVYGKHNSNGQVIAIINTQVEVKKLM